ncbi:hypothetical protein [Donghicola tyrosinivorans]|uniref:Hint domain-containing protein n=1 Tax=Donghicola tyrosinivorans TaxID=1652492 RepID=A0A2T0X5M0_9RHOB|nr:hypothetical protein [Donghicola tyrosinivorans]PRY94226.1 hypothetical protein CLV74_101362 [Donghicola tyrosinivorans]
MVQNLTQQDIDHLKGLVGNSYAEGVGNRDAYYSYLEERGYQYGGLAGGVVREDSLSGRIANAFLAETAAQSGNAINLSTSLEISYDLMVADLNARAAMVAANGYAGLLDAEVHYENHKDVFSEPDYGLGIENWTAAEPLEYYIENYDALGFDNPTQAANEAMAYMMSLDTVAEFFQFQFAVGRMIDFQGATLSSRAELARWQLISQNVALEHAGYIASGTGTPFNTNCFKSDTPIQIWPLDPSIKPRADGTYDEQLVLSKVWEKPICEIRVGDLVVSYDDKDGNLKPGRVLRTFRNEATHILDFWGTGVTPGHAYLCADGVFKDQHVPLMDILRTDGAIMLDDGTLIRAAINCEVGSPEDQFVLAVVGEKQPNGRVKISEARKIRVGTRIILRDGQDTSLLELITANGGQVTNDGLVQTSDGRKLPFRWELSEHLPAPEDYILQCSDVTLEAIYAAGEWESIGTKLSAPLAGQDAPAIDVALGSRPVPNIPPAFADHPDAPAQRSTKVATPFLS